MKKSVLLGIIALAAGAVTSYGQGYITLDNYSPGGAGSEPAVTYGAIMPINGVSGAMAAIGDPVSSDWTVGLYWVGGTSGLVQAGGTGLPDASLTLGTGLGSTVAMAGPNTFGSPGYYSSIPAFNSGSTLNTTITLEVVVYPTVDGSYANALNYRGHSAAFFMLTVGATSGSPADTGLTMPGTIVVNPVPEPTTLALGGLGGLAMLLLRRKKA